MVFQFVSSFFCAVFLCTFHQFPLIVEILEAFLKQVSKKLNASDKHILLLCIFLLLRSADFFCSFTCFHFLYDIEWFSHTILLKITVKLRFSSKFFFGKVNFQNGSWSLIPLSENSHDAQTSILTPFTESLVTYVLQIPCVTVVRWPQRSGFETPESTLLRRCDTFEPKVLIFLSSKTVNTLKTSEVFDQMFPFEKTLLVATELQQITVYLNN